MRASVVDERNRPERSHELDCGDISLAACVDMWEPFRLSLAARVPQCKIVYDKFHIIQHANNAIDEVRRAEFFRHGKKKREVIRGKKWLLMSRWKNLTATN